MQAPLFALQDARGVGKSFDAQQLFSGKTTLVSFFAFWCKPCAAEVPEFRALADRYADRGFQVVLISVDRDQDDILDFLELSGAGDLLVLWDEKRAVKDLYRVTQVPRNVRVDPDGSIGAAWEGYLPNKLEELGAYLAGLPPLTTPTAGPASASTPSQ